MTSRTPEHRAVAGWYAVDPQTERWWDGQEWTAAMRPLAPVAPVRRKVITKTPKRTSHTFHLLMTILTCGLWGFVWAAMTIINKLSRDRSVTRY